MFQIWEQSPDAILHSPRSRSKAYGLSQSRDSQIRRWGSRCRGVGKLGGGGGLDLALIEGGGARPILSFTSEF